MAKLEESQNMHFMNLKGSYNFYQNNNFWVDLICCSAFHSKENIALEWVVPA